MLKNYIKIAWRNLQSNKLFSLINIVGLAVGITCCVVIYLYVQRELSFDTHNKNADRIYRITTEAHLPTKTDFFAASSSMVAQRIKANFKEAEQVVRIEHSKRIISNGDKKFFDTKIAWTDSGFFNIFTVKMLEGDPRKALAAPYSIVLTESAARKYFGDDEAYGKTIKLSDTINLQVTGIIENIPSTSHFNLDCLLSRNTLEDLSKNNAFWKDQLEKDWFYCSLFSYVLLQDGKDPKELEVKINTVFAREMVDVKKNTGMWMNVRLQPLKDIHLRSHLEGEYNGVAQGDIIYVYIFSAVAILILLIACCNFINLSTARSINRSKEIGLRKVIGANRSQLVAQFLGESVIYTVLASILSFILLLFLLPVFNNILESELRLKSSVVWIYLAVIVSVGFLAGLYPALLMSAFAPVRSLKGLVKHGVADIFFRKGLVIFQFTIAIGLIVGTLLILRQLDYIQNRNLGITKEHLVSVELKGPDIKRRDVILKELSGEPYIAGATITNFSYKGIPNLTMQAEGMSQNELTACPVFAADENFIPTFGVKLVAGRNFSKAFPTDVAEAFIVNEAAVKAFGWKSPQNAIGKTIQWPFDKNGRVIGVVKDFNFASLHENIQPLIIHVFPQWFNAITLRLKPGDTRASMARLETAWKKATVESPFKYAFVEDDFNALYRSELNLRNLLSIFTFFSVLVACLGLFGLAAFAIRQRFKEIGIRRVLGSTTTGIVTLLSKDFLKLVLLSCLIAFPVSWWLMHSWLQDFEYRIKISWWTFVVAGLSAILIALITVSFQAIRAAIANPVKSLRTE